MEFVVLLALCWTRLFLSLRSNFTVGMFRSRRFFALLTGSRRRTTLSAGCKEEQVKGRGRDKREKEGASISVLASEPRRVSRERAQWVLVAYTTSPEVRSVHEGVGVLRRRRPATCRSHDSGFRSAIGFRPQLDVT